MEIESSLLGPEINEIIGRGTRNIIEVTHTVILHTKDSDIELSKVVLPAPLGPTRKTNSPLSISILILDNAIEPLSYNFETFFICINLNIPPLTNSKLLHDFISLDIFSKKPF